MTSSLRLAGAGRSVAPALAPAADRLRQLVADPSRPAFPIAVQGPAGSGKSVLLDELGRVHRAAGRTVILGIEDLAGVSAGTDAVVVIDDAHGLTARALDPVMDLLDRPEVSLLVAYRPWPRTPELTGLIERMGSARQLVVLGHADRETVLRWAREELGDRATPGLVDAVHYETAGLPDLVHRFLRALPCGPQQGTPGARPDLRSRMALPAQVVESLRTDVARLDEPARALLHAIAVGAPVDADLLGEVLGLPAALAGDLVGSGRASGWLLACGTLVPVVRKVLLSTLPAEVTRQTRRRLLGLLLDRGEEPVEIARSLAADGIRDPRAAELLERHGTAALTGDAARASELLAGAVRSGAPPARVAARQAQAASLTGDVDTALRFADAVLSDAHAPDRARAARVAAAALAQRGLPARSAGLYRLAGPACAGSAALALLSTGDRAGAEEALLERDGSVDLGSMLAASEELMARGVLASLGSTDEGEGVAAALSTLTRASLLLEPVGHGAVLLDTPAALTALVALHCGELDLAESVLRRALSVDLGGESNRRRHLLLLAWVDMLRGRFECARDHMDLARGVDGPGMEPRDDLYLQALEVGLARRSSDVPRLVRAWSRVRQAMLRHPIELFTLLPLGELVVAAARLKDTERLVPHVAEAEALLDRLGRPRLWSTALHWSGVQAAILADDPMGLRPHAAALVEAARSMPYAATLARAGRCLLRVLRNEVEAAEVVSAAEELGTVGLAWDGSRLAGQAAARAADARDRSVLLGCARSLAEDIAGGRPERNVPAPEGPAGPSAARPAFLPGGQLSDREREVARLVVAGQTYREIGASLFISAKTVEHHVARMRQRLGSPTRSDLIAALRAELDDGRWRPAAREVS